MDSFCLVITELSKDVNTALYADDFVLWCTEEYATTANYGMQIALDKVVTWAEQWCVNIREIRVSKRTCTCTSMSG